MEAIQELLDKPFMDLMFQAQSVHREHWPAGTSNWPRCCPSRPAAAPENCGYRPQAAEFDTGVKAEKLMSVDEVRRAAQAAKDAGATRFAWVRPGARPRIVTSRR